jgi:hypothetical protein
MSIEFNYVFIQDGTMIYLLYLIDHSWTMGLNFGDMVLNQLNLIKVKKKHFHHHTLIKICFSSLICFGRWEGGLVFGGRYLLMVSQVI